MNDPVAPITTVQVASLFIGIILPILVGLVTKKSTNSAVKAVLLMLLSSVSGFLTEYVNSDNFVWQQALLTSVMTFVVAGAAHWNIWKPTGATDAAQGALVKDDPPA